jgi:hypothetical protein
MLGYYTMYSHGVKERATAGVEAASGHNIPYAAAPNTLLPDQHLPNARSIL